MCLCVCRTYCETDIDPAHRKLSQLQAVTGYLTGKEPELDCKCSLHFEYIISFLMLFFYGKWVCMYTKNQSD